MISKYHPYIISCHHHVEHCSYVPFFKIREVNEIPFRIQPLARLCNHPQASQAMRMMSCLPPTLIQMIDGGTWPGEGCMVLSSPISRPTAAEIAQNHCFLKPFVMTYPTKAPQVSKQRVVLSIQSVFNAGILQT